MVLGDPAGIGPELIAKLLAQESVRRSADILVIADKHEVEEGMRVAGCRFEYAKTDSLGDLKFDEMPLLHDFRGASAGPFVRAQASIAGGRYTLDTLKAALDVTLAGKTDAILFAPLNKSSLHMAGMTCADELHWFAEQIGYQGPFFEFNAMDGLWTFRVPSPYAVKLMGFSRGVSLCGRLPIPITTPSHGTAFDIATKGVANVSATLQAFHMACRLGRSYRLPHSANQAVAN